MDVKRRDVLKGAAATTAAVAVGAPAIINADAELCPASSMRPRNGSIREFQPSTLTKDQQMAEMEWFIKASQPFKGMKVSCASEILSIHEYESKTLTKAFAEITGIQVNHEMMDEGLHRRQDRSRNPVRQADLRFLDERFRLHRHASALQRHRRRLADRFHGQRRQGHHQSQPRSERLHRSILRDLHRRQTLPATRSAIRQSLLVPLRLVPTAGAQGRVQETIRLRPRRAGQLVGL